VTITREEVEHRLAHPLWELAVPWLREVLAVIDERDALARQLAEARAIAERYAAIAETAVAQAKEAMQRAEEGRKP